MRLPRMPLSRRKLREQRDHLARRVEALELRDPIDGMVYDADRMEREIERARAAERRLEDSQEHAEQMMQDKSRAMRRCAELETERDELMRGRDYLTSCLDDALAEKHQAVQARDEARARVAELEAAIREFCDEQHKGVVAVEGGKRWLRSVLDGHERQEREPYAVTYPDGSGYLMNWEADGDR